jgi:hypothetical protein
MNWQRGDLAMAIWQGGWVTPDGDSCVGVKPGTVWTVRNLANILGHIGLQFEGREPWYAASAFVRIPPHGEIEGVEEPRRAPVRETAQ